MDIGHFYFLKDQYFIDFPDPYLMGNKGVITGSRHGRPCFYAIPDSTSLIYWLVPISSKTTKYRAIYNNKIARLGRCDTIVFGYVLGYEKAFLIQNICPATSDYITSEYLDSINSSPVMIDKPTENTIIKNANSVISMTRRGKRIVFPDILQIESKLITQLKSQGLIH